MVQHRCHDKKDPEQGTVPTGRASPTSHKDKQVLLKSPLLLSSICEEICTHIRGKGESLLSTLLYVRGKKKKKKESILSPYLCYLFHCYYPITPQYNSVQTSSPHLPHHPKLSYFFVLIQHLSAYLLSGYLLFTRHCEMCWKYL